MLGFKSNPKTLGQARSKRSFDLALNDSGGSGFLRLLIALMTLLTLLALSAGFVLSEMSTRWASGVQGSMSAEIPAQDEAGKTLPWDKVKDVSDKVADVALTHPAIKSAVPATKDEIAALIAPWLGDDIANTDGAVPLPGLVTITLKDEAEINLQAFEERLKTVSETVRLDTHEGWLKDVLTFTGALQFAAYLLTLIITLTTIIAVAGAIRAKMAVHGEEIELLHLMGASDSYIAAQFQRHALWMAFQGAVIGCILGAIALALIGWQAGRMDIALVPDLHMTLGQHLGLATLPIVISLLAMGTARFAVLRDLRQMP